MLNCRNEDGTFRTSRPQESPPLFCAGLARAITDQWDASLRRGLAHPVPSSAQVQTLVQWITEAREACTEIRQGTVWLPDYQRI